MIGLPSLTKLITLRDMSVSLKLQDSVNLQLEVDVARRLHRVHPPFGQRPLAKRVQERKEETVIKR